MNVNIKSVKKIANNLLRREAKVFMAYRFI